MSLIEVRNVSFGYGHKTPFEVQALKNVSLSVEKGECVSVIGHTGSGKSTLMQMLNALIKPESGEILLEGKNINADKKSVAAARFKVGLCFQYPEYQLFGETCFEDIAFGPKNMGLSEEEIKKRVLLVCEFVGLSKDKLKESPFDLSGGQKRRCAIAGVMAMLPEVLILDEPTAGLDPAGRLAVLDMIKNYRDKTGATVILVTHSMEIAASMSNRILVLNKGERAFFGTPEEIFSHSDELIAMGLNVPSFAKIISALKKEGFAVEDAYTVEAAAESIKKLLKGEVL
ncbi:MAG: energy-coupling factor transporter ATPase [Oscillospiraceae bacterium]|nr:energy-coupling factor transporter ATPase [Oscillospiraceae bacterium]